MFYMGVWLDSGRKMSYNRLHNQMQGKAIFEVVL